jgi:tetratricopeptide (TPR) repeat protein
VLESLGETEAALGSYDRAIRLNRERGADFAAPYINLSAYYNRLDDSERALEYARQALAANPRSDLAYYQMAKAYHRREEWTPAAAALEKAVAINTYSAQYHYLLAAVYRKLGKPAESQASIETFNRLQQQSREHDQKRRELRVEEQP